MYVRGLSFVVRWLLAVAWCLLCCVLRGLFVDCYVYVFVVRCLLCVLLLLVVLRLLFAVRCLWFVVV